MNFRARREWKLRLFQQLHQNDDPDWHRSSGGILCELCGLPYRNHLADEEHPFYGDGHDKRLCDGRVVHL